MAESHGRMANMLLRYAAPLSRLRHIPVLGGFLSWSSNRLVPRNTLIWVKISRGPAQGLWIRVNPRTGSAVQQGLGEPVVQEAFQKHLRWGMTFYDLGANIGFFSLLAARLVGTAGRVIAFEADPEIASRLRENLVYNKFTHTSVEQKAVWSSTGSLTFERVDANASPDRGLGHIASNPPSGAQTIQVEGVTLDRFVESHPAPDFIKCDVEGAETAVFSGAQRLLQTKRPILLVEMHNAENHRSLTAQYEQLRYICNNLDENHVLALPQ